MNSLKRTRLLRDITQEELAIRAGLSRQVIIKMENDEKYRPSFLSMQKVSKVLGETVDNLFFNLDVNHE